MLHRICSSGPTTRRYCAILLFAPTCTLCAQSARAQYTESYQTWSATSAATWQTKDLSGAPFNVPASAVVEVAVLNANSGSTERAGGVRAVGSSLERRIDIHAAHNGGVGALVMHVQSDASSQIQHYSADTTDVTFLLLGYWDCGVYVERFDSFDNNNGWNDKDLNTFGVSAGHVVEMVLTENLDASFDVGVRTNGSTLERRVTLHRPGENKGENAVTMLAQADNSASATIETYSGDKQKTQFYLVGYWSAAPGTYTETFADFGSPSADATWEDIDLTASGAPDNSVVEVLFTNDDRDEENEIGVRANGSALARVLDIHEDEKKGVNAGRMHTLSDAAAVIEFYHQDVSDLHNYYLLGYWDVGAVLSDHTAGQESDAFQEQGGETNAELFAFRITPCSGTVTVTQIIFRLTGIVGLTDPDWAGVELILDANDNGAIGVGETTTVGGGGTVDQAAGTITFSASFDISASTHLILRADFASLSDGDKVTIGLSESDITTTATISGSTTFVTHKEGCDYIETLATWTATSADIWQTQDLSGAPFNVPGGTVVEVAVRNDNTSTERFGGVRTVGSSLERRFLIRNPEGVGISAVTMHVQTDAGSMIQHYSDVTADVDFLLLGYWECGTFVETFDTFTAGIDNVWQDENLCAYGVGPAHVAEIVMTNDHVTTSGGNHLAGIRTNGSSLDRRMDLQNAEDGGVECGTMFVKADDAASATIEINAGDDTYIDFYLVGYWSAAPKAYSELFADVGSPTVDNAWQDLDLTLDGVPDNAIAEFVMSNDFATTENEMGVRANGSSLNREIDLMEAEDGGGAFYRAQVLTDTTATIEFQHEDVSEAHTFRLVGYWSDCNSSISYVVSDLGAVTASESSLGLHINGTDDVAGFDEDAAGNPGAWFSECGSFTSLGTLGGADGEALGINDANEVVGWAHDASGNRKAYTWTSGGGMTDLGTVSSRTDSEATAINASSEVVGTVLDFGVAPVNHLAFLYLPAPAYTLSAGMNSLGTLGGTRSVAMDINDSGQVVGGAENASQFLRPYRWQNGTMTDLGTLGGESGRVHHRSQAINSLGDVVGLSYTAGGDAHAFLWDGSMTDLGVLTGGDTSWAFGINDNNVVVGASNVTGGVFHAFVWDSTNGMRDLNDLISGSWILTRAVDINKNGLITGWGTNPSGKVRAFLLTSSCSSSGGGAAAATAPGSVIGAGSGKTDGAGVFEGLVLDADGESLGAITILEADPDVSVQFEVAQPDDAVGAGIGLAPGTLEGFADGVAIPRTLAVVTAADEGHFLATVSMTFFSSELDDAAVDPEEVELHVFDTTLAPPPGVWVPAGKSIGESVPTGIVGDSGFEIFSDSTVSFWAVRNATGVFAVGAAAAAQEGGSAQVDENQSRADVPSPRDLPPVCGFGLVPVSLVALTWLVAIRTGKYDVLG